MFNGIIYNFHEKHFSSGRKIRPTLPLQMLLVKMLSWLRLHSSKGLQMFPQRDR